MNVSDQLMVVREGIDSDPWFMTCASKLINSRGRNENAEYIYGESKPPK